MQYIIQHRPCRLDSAIIPSVICIPDRRFFHPLRAENLLPFHSTSSSAQHQKSNPSNYPPAPALPFPFLSQQDHSTHSHHHLPALFRPLVSKSLIPSRTPCLHADHTSLALAQIAPPKIKKTTETHHPSPNPSQTSPGTLAIAPPHPAPHSADYQD